MPLDTALITLFHLLVFAYWLGGDLGVFYASTLFTDENRPDAGRLTAGKILSDVDLVPRFCLLLALPTGLALAAAKKWLSINPLLIIAAFVVALGWCWLVWTLHIRHTGTELLRKIDTYCRYTYLLSLFGLAIAALTGMIFLPLFIVLKLIILGIAIGMGLYIRHALRDFGPAYGDFAENGATPENNAIIQKSLNQARPAVMVIWLALAIAAFLGVATPV